MSLAAGCAKRGPDASASPAMDGGGAGDELAMLEQQLAQREAQLQAVGVGSKAAVGTAAGPVRDEGGDKQAEATSAPPSSMPRPSEPAPMADSTSAAGLSGATRQGAAEDEAPGGRCEHVCEIAAAICALEGQICGLVPRHPGDERYQAACERAAGDCRYATEACHVCA